MVHATSVFEFGHREAAELTACDRSIAHHRYGLDEVVTDGRKQGTVKKFFGTEKSRAKICRLEIAKSILKLFHRIVQSGEIEMPESLKTFSTSKIYCDLKAVCKRGFEQRSSVFDTYFPASAARLERRKRLDDFSIMESSVSASSVRKRKVLLLSGVQEGGGGDDLKNEFVETLQKADFDPRRIPVLKTEICNQVSSLFKATFCGPYHECSTKSN